MSHGVPAPRRVAAPRNPLAGPVALLILVIAVVVTGNKGGSLLAVHIPAAVATMGLIVRQAPIATQASEAA